MLLCAPTASDVHTHTPTYTHRLPCAPTYTHRLTCAPTGSHVHTRTPTGSHVYTYTHRLPCAFPYTHRLPCAHPYTHRLPCAHPYTHRLPGAHDDRRQRRIQQHNTENETRTAQAVKRGCLPGEACGQGGGQALPSLHPVPPHAVVQQVKHTAQRLAGSPLV